MNKGNILASLGDYLEAIECYGNAINIKGNAAYKYFAQDGYLDKWRWNKEKIECYMGKGNTLCKLEKYQEAIECYNRVIKLAFDNADAYNNKGNALSNLERYLEAIKCYNKAIRLVPDEPQFFLNRARVFEKLGRQQKALQDFNIADDLMQKFNQNNK